MTRGDWIVTGEPDLPRESQPWWPGGAPSYYWITVPCYLPAPKPRDRRRISQDRGRKA